MTAGVMEAIPEMDWEHDNTNQIPEMVTTYDDLQTNNQAEILLPGVQPLCKEGLSAITRLLKNQELKFRTGAVDGELVFYPTTLHTAKTLLEFSQRRQHVAIGLFQAIYNSPDGQ